jgi:hypothetical protein
MSDQPKQGLSLFDFADMESQLIRRNGELAGEFAKFAETATAMFSSTVTHVPRNRALFMGVYSMVRKHLVLAVLSALRQHKVQASLNMRQAIEAAVVMVFLIANADPASLADGLDEDGRTSDKLNAEARKWLTANYPVHSKALKEMKDDINSTDSHANIVNSYATFDYDSVELGFSENRFFDRDDKDILEISLWNIGHITAYIIATFVKIASDEGSLKLVADVNERIEWLSATNDRLIKTIQMRPRWADLIKADL